MRIAFVTDELPVPGVAGHLALNFSVLRWLTGLGHEVGVLLVGSRLAWPVMRYGVAPVAGPRVRRWGGVLVAGSPVPVLGRAFVRSLPAGLAAPLRRRRHRADAVLGQFASAEDVRWCAEYIGRTRPDAVLVDTIFRAGILSEPELADLNSVLIAHDVFFRRHLALTSAGYRVSPERLTREDEAAWLCQARHIAAIQPEEAEVLRGIFPGGRVFLLPMPAVPVPPPASVARQPGRLVFVGSASLPNLDGLRWFFEKAWPLLRNRGITLDLIGDCGAALRGLPAGVTRVGRVRNLAPFLHRSALAVAPLKVGSGLKIKLLDYARHGLMTVATPASLEGFAADPAWPFVAAEDAGAFARAILGELSNPAGPERPLAYVARHYGESASFSGLEQALGEGQKIF